MRFAFGLLAVAVAGVAVGVALIVVASQYFDDPFSF